MAYIPRSSFIPKEASGVIPMQVKKKRTIRVFSLLSSALLIASLVSAIGTFLYKDYAMTQLEAAKSQLQAVSDESNNAEDIAEIRLYDEKLMIAKNLIENHIAPSKIFSELESSTKESVQFDSFELNYDPGFEVELTLGGNSNELSAIALQKAQFAKDSIFTHFAVQDISAPIEVGASNSDAITGTSPITSFTINGLFDKKSIAYEGRSSAPVTQVEETAPESLFGLPVGGAQESNTITP
jgi:hypothetical protein